MATYKEAFVAYLQKEGLKYTDIDERAVRMSWNADNVAAGLEILVIFDKENHNGVHFMCTGFCKVPENKLGAMLIACNEANKQYRWFKFYVTDKQEIMAEDDAILDMANVGEECVELVARMVNVVDEAYPSFMKAIYA
ncbi:MAG: YbjN domain-containing protein [Oscillospiraceae bacterium]|nr:YbjN domain-containing protein [Oscillospiraceae bacterium]